MKIKWKNTYVRMGVTALLVVCGGILFYYLLFHGSNIKTAINTLNGVLMPVMFGIILAYLLTPVLNSIEQRILLPLYGLRAKQVTAKARRLLRGGSILITLCLICFIIQLLFRMLLSQIVPSIQNIVSNFDSYVNNFTTWLNRLLENNPSIQQYVAELIDRYSGELENFLNNTVLRKSSELLMTVSLSVINFLKVLWNFILGLIISIYILASKETFATQAKKLTYAVFERDGANVLINNVRFAHKTFSGFISGKILDSLIIGVLCFVGTSLLHTPYAMLVSVIIGVTNIIPFFGPFLGGIPSVVLVFVVNPTQPMDAVYFALFVLFLQQLDGNLIGPKILGNSTGLASFWVIFSITFFGGFFGVFGMIVGVPLFAVIYAAIRSNVNEALLKKKMPLSTESYSDIEYITDDGIQPRKEKPARRRRGQEADPDQELRSGQRFISDTEEWRYRCADFREKKESEGNPQADSSSVPGSAAESADRAGE